MFAVYGSLFLGGCIWGLIPLLISLYFKRSRTGVLLMAVCGASAVIFGGLCALVIAILASLYLLFSQPSEKPVSLPGEQWQCAGCGRVNQGNKWKCFCGYSWEWSRQQQNKK